MKIIVKRQGWNLAMCIWPSLAVVTASLILMPLVHLALIGKMTYTPGGQNFIFGKLVRDGLAQRWLRDNCPAPGIKVCAMQDRLPKTADEFPWGEASPFRDIDAWTGTADWELEHLVKGCIEG